MYYEGWNDINRAIEREKNLKNWNREWKVNLIKKDNPTYLTFRPAGEHFIYWKVPICIGMTRKGRLLIAGRLVSQCFFDMPTQKEIITN